MVFSHDEEELVYVLRLVFGSINLVAIICILLVYACVKELHYFMMRLVIYMLLSDLLRSAVLLLDSANPAECTIQAVFLQYTLNCGVLWTLNIGVALYLRIVREEDAVEHKEGLMIGLGYGIPVALAVIPFFFHGYGRGGGWCWISNDHGDVVGLLLRVVCFYIPLLIVTCCCIVIYTRVIQAIREHLDGIEQEVETERVISNRLVYYPMVLIVCYLPLFAKGAWEYFSESKAEFVFTAITIVLAMSSGLLNVFIYGYNETVKHTINRWTRRQRTLSRISLPGVNPNNLV